MDERIDRDRAATALVRARRGTDGSPGFPGALPATLEEAYAIQDAASRLWEDVAIGWKVGRIAAAEAAVLGEDRFIGPVFGASTAAVRAGAPMAFPVWPQGCAAFEAEFAAVLGEDARPDRVDWDAASARGATAALRIAIEVAGSPIGTLPDLGPLATIAAFGNNAGMILGPVVPGWQAMHDDDLTVHTTIDDAAAVARRASALPGGPFQALAFALNRAAALGKPLRAGQIVLTGAVTGMLPVVAGQRCSADFGAAGRIDCHVVPVAASSAEQQDA